MFLTLTFIIFALAGWLTALIGSHRRFLHLLQLEDYESGRMLREIVRYPRRLQLLGWELLGIMAILILRSQLSFPYIDHVHAVKPDVFLSGQKVVLILRALNKAWYLAWFIWGAGCLWRAWRMRIRFKSAKKPLVMTTRAKRIFWTSLITLIMFTFAAIIIVTIIRYNNIYLEYGGAFPWFSIRWTAYFWISVFVIMYLCERMVPLFLALTVNLLKPVESSVQNRYLNDAKRILREVNPLVIGITGSYGKTGTKEMLAAMLAEKYNVFRPPGSYNTLMGVTRVIRESLRPFHDVFVSEMGAYRIGSIAKLCNLVRPKHGIITIIGVQHLERFKSKENIKTAKGELIRALPKDGIAVLNGDDPACREIGADFKGKVVYFSVEEDNETEESINLTELASLQVENIKIGTDGSDFDFVFAEAPTPFRNDSRDFKRGLTDAPPPSPPPQSGGGANNSSPSQSRGGASNSFPLQSGGRALNASPPLCGGELKGGAREMIPVHLSLLGRSAIHNAAAAAAMADQLGVPRKSIVAALARMPHVKHRLEPIKQEGGITVLDDAFNSNPIGAKNALEVLCQAKGGRRVLVTPGMVELGDLEERANYEFGRQAAEACDLVVLVGQKRIEPIKRGLIDAGFDKNNIWVAGSLDESLKRLKSYLKQGDTMLLENDLPDQYDFT